MAVYSPINATHSTNTNIIELNAETDSKISHVRLYSSQAEIVRVFKFDAAAGHNGVNIKGLSGLIPDSLR